MTTALFNLRSCGVEGPMSVARVIEYAPIAARESAPPPFPNRRLDALEDLIRDPAFKASERNKRFLRFIVTETLAGRASRIKAYTIAVDVFARPPDFDPAGDPIVRIEATRLRAALASYYGGSGRGAPLRIEIPKGGYVPAFVEGPPEEAAVSTDVPPASSGGDRRQAIAEALQLRVPLWLALAATSLSALAAALISVGLSFN
jgi:hypothetical protein